MKKAKKKNRGFTLVEIMVVVLIIAMLAAFVAPKVFKRFGRAQRNLAVAGISRLAGAVEEFAMTVGRYPYDDEGLAILTAKTAPEGIDAGQWDGPYITEKQLSDPWGNNYIYAQQGQHNEGGFDIISMGPDGQANTPDDIFNE